MSVEAPAPVSRATGESVSLLEVLDRVLNQGVTLTGDLIISVADVDLLYVSLRALVASVETALQAGAGFPPMISEREEKP